MTERESLIIFFQKKIKGILLKNILENEEFWTRIQQGNNTVTCVVTKHRVQLWKNHNTYSIDFKFFRIVLRFRFPNYQAKFWLHCYVLNYDSHSVRSAQI